MRNSMITGLLALSLTAVPVMAQMAPQEKSQTLSHPGEMIHEGTIRASVIVTAIDKTTRTLTLKDAKGQNLSVIADKEVRNFDQIKVGDEIKVEYFRSLSLQLKKPGEAAVASGAEFAERAHPGEKPGMAVGKTTTVMATVIDVNPENKTITLQGPKGNIVELDVKNQDHFKVVKKGDQVEATYSEALAVYVETVAKK